MNILKSSSPIRLIAFFLVAVMLICTFGFAVDGWSFKEKSNDKITGTAGGNAQKPSNSQSDNSGEEKEPADTEPEIYVPKYTSYITGLEVSEALSKRRPIAVVMNADNAGYSISAADLLAEFPTEDGSTRIMALITDFSSAGKIGAILPTRNYISNLACYFGAITLSYGIDDSVFYDSCDFSSSHFDLTQYSGYHYSEFSQYQYTNSDLLFAGLKNASLSTAKIEKELPYLFNEFGKEPISADTKAQSVSIVYSDSSSTELLYSADTSKYTLYKNNEIKKDMLNSKNVDFTNCLVLFADSITYENFDGEQMVMNTVGQGTGYYFTSGTATGISWSADANGNMAILDESGEKLTVNRGNTYIGFVKSSKVQNVTFK